nr:hypothetical protein CKG001_21480 [Bdellovibrio sp. CKG001]
MNKILLVYEDYADLMSVEGTLKKVGFDVIGLTSEYSVAEQMLAFNPDLVVGAGKGAKVSSLGVGKRLKEMARWQGKSLLIFPANFKPNPQDLIKIRVDMVLESPVPPLRLVQVIGRMLGHDEALLLDRLNKAMHVESPQKSATTVSGKYSPEGEAIYVKGTTPEESADSASLRTERVHEDSEEGALSSEEQGEKIAFRFGDRMQAADSERSVAESSESAFPDVDMKAFERELFGGGVPAVERVEETTPQVVDEVLSGASSETEESLADVSVRALESLKKAEIGLSEKINKYAKMVEDVKVAPKSTVSRVEARRRQKTLEESWDRENISEIDKLRQEFTKALFKK